MSRYECLSVYACFPCSSLLCVCKYNVKENRHSEESSPNENA